jgi:hypothetical protein
VRRADSGGDDARTALHRILRGRLIVGLTIPFALAWRYECVNTLWTRIRGAKAGGLSLDAVREPLSIDSAFPELRDKRRDVRGRDGANVDSHAQNIQTH